MSREKRTLDLPTSTVQNGNQSWWTSHTMSYDWKHGVRLPRFSAAWFDEIDRRFVEAARLFATDKVPFDRVIPFERLRGKRVLEIGCGMGMHSELIARAGANLTSIDLSPTSVEATARRRDLKGLSFEVRQADAESLPFPNCTFDYVWSWGVIHHSARTARIVREIARVLRRMGECRVMVYNRNGMSAKLTFLKDYIAKGRFLSEDFEETLYRTTDGFSARYYPQEQFEDLFRAYFRDVSSFVCGQEPDAVPLPRFIRPLVVSMVPENALVRLQARYGSFLVLTATAVDDLSAPAS